MVEAQRRTGRVVQVGLNRRGSPVYRQLAPLVRDGLIGKVTLARAYRVDNMAPNGIGREKPEDPPPGLDWDLWLGPRASRPYQYNIAPYRFRWWKDYSSQMGNWGVHYMDVDPLADRRAGPGRGLGPRGPLRGGRRPHDPRHDGGDLRDAGRRPRRLRHLRGRGRQPDRRAARSSSWARRARSWRARGAGRVRPSRPGQFQDWKALVEPREEKEHERARTRRSGSSATSSTA